VTQPKKLIEGDRRRIRITQAEIDKAKPQQSGRCLVARAIAAKFPDASRIDVDQQTIRFTRNGERWVYLTPWAVQRYIVEFDGGDPIEPFEFALTQSVQIQRQTRTDTGRRVARSGQTVRNKRKRLNELQDQLLPPPDSGRRPSPEARQIVEAAKAEVARLEVEHEMTKAAVQASGEEQFVTNRTDVPRRAAATNRGITRSRTSTRHYGHREMKINQDRAERTASAIEAEAGLSLPSMPKGGYESH
jgi:hypothetical protein